MNDLFRSQFRLPAELAESLREAAAANNRSMNAEIVARLQGTFDSSSARPGSGRGLTDDEVATAVAIDTEEFTLFRLQAQLDTLRTRQSLTQMQTRLLDERLDQMAYRRASKEEMAASEAELKEAKSAAKEIAERIGQAVEEIRAQEDRVAEVNRARMRQMNDRIDAGIQGDLRRIHELENELLVPEEKRAVTRPKR